MASATGSASGGAATGTVIMAGCRGLANQGFIADTVVLPKDDQERPVIK